MANLMSKSFWSKNYWVRETLSGGIEYRTSSVVLFTLLSVLLAVLFYMLLITIEGLENGREILEVLTYSIGVLLVAMIFLVIIIWLLEYLHKFE